MSIFTLKRALAGAIACAAIPALLPGVAAASTWTVDDDKAQCPNAAFTSIQAAVNQAAPWDTIKVCDGLYQESSTPTSGANTPSQAGSKNGLTIGKPLTIKGAGASKVTIQPSPSLAPTLAGTAPYLRDGGGNVVTISRNALGSTDFDEMFVSISGVTISSPDIFAEAGVAFFNTSGEIKNSVVGPLKKAADATELAANPHGWGIVMTNHLQGASEATVRREVTVKDSLVTGYQAGGILFDDSRGTDGAATLLTRSGIKAYGFVSGTKVAGGGPQTLYPQTGIRFHAGQRGSVVGSEITGNEYTPDPRQSVGLLLTDAETGPDPANPAVRGFFAQGNAFTGNGYGMFNADIANTSLREGAPALATGPAATDENWWGCALGPVLGGASTLAGCQGISGLDSTPAPTIELGTPRASAPAALSAPGATTDSAPAVSFFEPLDGEEFAPGTKIDPIVSATDDFGIKSVKLTINGSSLGTDTAAPYDDFTWTPSWADIGKTFTLKATVTDSSDQVTTAEITIKVPVPAGYEAITVDPTSWDAGTVLIGNTNSKLVTITNSGQNPLALDGLTVAGAAFSKQSTTCPATLPVGESCTVTVKFAPESEGALSGSLKIDWTAPPGGDPIVIPLTGTGELLKTEKTATVSASVPNTLGITLSTTTPSLGTFLPGVAQDYTAGITAGITTTALNSQFTVVDPSATAPGHLVNGPFALDKALQAKATNAANPGTAFASISGSPLTLLTFPTPVTNDPVAVSFKQSIGENESLRAGTYSKTLVFTLSSTTP